MNFTYRGTIGGDSTMQIRLWRQGKKTVAVFDGESRVSRQTRINHDDKFRISNRPLPKLTLKSMQIGERHDELSKAVLETHSETAILPTGLRIALSIGQGRKMGP
jgi:hypothetical protein